MNVLWKRRFWLVVWTLCVVSMTATSGVFFFLSPVVDSWEDHETALWAATTAGRFSIAWRSVPRSFFLALFPALYVFWATKDLAKSETLARLNPKRTAVVMWAVMVVCGVLGALAFWFQVHPLQRF